MNHQDIYNLPSHKNTKKNVKTNPENFLNINQRFERSCNLSFDTKWNVTYIDRPTLTL